MRCPCIFLSIESPLSWFEYITPPKFNSEFTPEKLPSQRESSLKKPSFFRGYVKLQGCNRNLPITFKLVYIYIYMIPVSGYTPPPPPPNVMTLSTLPIAPMTIWRPPCCFEGELAEIEYRITSGHVWSLEYLFMP